MAPDKPFKHVTDSTKLHVIHSMSIVAPAQTTLPEQSSLVLLNYTAISLQQWQRVRRLMVSFLSYIHGHIRMPSKKLLNSAALQCIPSSGLWKLLIKQLFLLSPPLTPLNLHQQHTNHLGMQHTIDL